MRERGIILKVVSGQSACRQAGVSDQQTDH